MFTADTWITVSSHSQGKAMYRMVKKSVNLSDTSIFTDMFLTDSL
jgi:hypothetical protein